MKIKDIKNWNAELDLEALVSVTGGHNKSYEYFWTHSHSPGGGWECYTQDSQAYDEC